MDYCWNGEQMWDVVSLPAKTAEFLKIAGPTQLRVLLWLATVGKGRGNAKDCSTYLGGRISPEECEDALRFWEAEGLLTHGKASKKAIVPSKPEPKPERKAEEIPTPIRPKGKSIEEIRAAKKVIPARTLQKGDQHKEFAFLLQTTEMQLGKTLSRADQDRLLDVYEQSNLPLNVILMVVSYAAKQDKKSISYIKAVAQSWADEGILDAQTANEHLCYLERTDNCWNQVALWLELDNKRVTVTQKQLAEKWLHQLKIKKPLLQLAYTRATEKTGKFQASYMDKVLGSWLDEGLTTPEKVEASEKPATPVPGKPSGKKTPSQQAGGFNADQYEKLVKKQTPIYRKKG
ncbi:MAG: DnaD domain protein [Clostridia bacterium]|nr:DnaD domain protein [Clostridia bacterium]